MANIFDIPKELLKSFFSVKDELANVEGMSQKNLKAFLEHSSISKFLKYRTYIEDEDKVGIYTMADGKKGIIFRVFPSPSSSATTEEAVYNLVDMLREKDTHIFLNTFASRNISYLLDDFKELHKCNVNVDNVNILKEMVDRTYTFLENGVNESIIGRFDNRIRDFVSTIGILFPKDTKDETIKQIYHQTIGNLSRLHPILFKGTHLIRMLREMMNPGKDMRSWQNLFDTHRVMNKQVTSTDTKIRTNDDNATIEVGEKWKYRVFTTKQYPSDKVIINNFDLYNLFFDRFRDNKQTPIPCPFYTSLVIKIDHVEKIKEKALAKSRDDLIKVGKLNRQLREADPDLSGRRTEAKRTIKLLTQDHELLHHGMFSITLMDESLDKLDKYSKVLKNRFSSSDWMLEEEKFGNIALFVLLYSLPLQEDRIVTKELDRFDLIFTSNCSGIAPLLGNFSNNRMMVPMFDGNWELIPYDNFNGDNYNEAKTGATGAGKSYSQAFVHIMKLAAGIKQRVIDRGRSYSRFAEVIGGTVIDVERQKDISMNFFTKPALLLKLDENGQETDEPVINIDKNGNKLYLLHPIEVEAIVPIIGLMVGLNFVLSGKIESSSDATDKSYLSSIITKAVIGAFARHQFQTNLEHVRHIILDYQQQEKESGNQVISELLLKVYHGLFDFADPMGAHYIKFNTPNNLNLEKDYVVLETSGLEGTILKVVAVTLASAIRAEFWKEGPIRKKSLDIDEGWKYIDDQIVIKIFDDNGRTFRKSLSSQSFITQSIEDFDTNDSTRALFKSSFHKFLLSQDPKGINRVTASDGFFPLSAFERRMFNSVSNKKPDWGEALYLSKNTPTQALLIKACPEVFWLISAADPEGNVVFNKLQKKYNLTLIETIRYLSEKDKNKELSHNDLIHTAKNYNKTKLLSEMKLKDYWKEELNAAFLEDRIQIKLEPIAALKNQEFVAYEVFSQIAHNDNSISSYGVFYKYIKEFEQEFQFFEHVLHKTFKYFTKEENNDINLHINVNSNNIINTEYQYLLFDLIKLYNVADRLTIEVKDVMTDDNSKELSDFIQKCHDMGIFIIIDNIYKSYQKIHFLIEMPWDGFKVDGSIIKTIDSNEAEFYIFNMLIDIALKSPLEKAIYFNKIETKKELKYLTGYPHQESFYIQGAYLKHETIVF